MKEICHLKLTEMVSKYGTTSFRRGQRKKLMNASIYPDRINKSNMRDNPYNMLPILVKWGLNHTLRAKELSITYTNKAAQAKEVRDPSWIFYLGCALHFITDRGTPHHSFTSKSNPILRNILSNAAMGGKLGSTLNSSKNLKEKAKQGSLTALITGLVSLGIESVDLISKHRKFEDFCDVVWNNHKSEVRKYIKSQKTWHHPPQQLDQGLRFLEIKIDQLHQFSNNIPSNWISICNLNDFAGYMYEIALVMDVACQIVKI